MTTLHIHFTMAAVGVGVCLAFVGLVNYRHHPAFKRTLLGIFAGGAVAISPFFASLSGVESENLLPKSVLLSLAAVLSCILFYTLSQWPIKANGATRSIPGDPSRDAVVLSAENPNSDVESAAHDPLKSEKALPTLLKPENTVEDFPTLELDEDSENEPIYDVSDDDIFDAPEAMKTLDESIDDSFDIDMAFADNTDANANAREPNSPIAANDDANSDDVAIDNSLIFELTGQHEIPTDVGIPEPTDKVIDEEFEVEHETSPVGPGTEETQQELELDVSSQSLSDINPTDDSDHPVLSHTLVTDAIARSLDLDKALRNQLDELESTLSALDAVSDEQSDESSADADDAVPSVPAVDAQSFDVAESDVHTANEKLMALQRQVLAQNEQQQQIIEALKEQSAAQIKQQAEETSRLRELIKNTTEITRQVAEHQRNLLDVAEQEKASRLKSEAAAKNALSIARKAISRLSMTTADTPSRKT